MANPRFKSETKTLHYILKDHQGNLTATICGNAVERLSYDAWGRHHNPVLADLQFASIEYQHL